MAASNSQQHEKHKCGVCNTPELWNLTYIAHIKSKGHLKNLNDRNRPQPNDESERTIQVTGKKHKWQLNCI